jgi:hypothetical protein
MVAQALPYTARLNLSLPVGNLLGTPQTAPSYGDIKKTHKIIVFSYKF